MAARKKNAPATASAAQTAALTDPVTDYAQKVVDGIIVAGPHVRAACARHLDDLINAPARGFTFNLEKVHRIINFFGQVLKLVGGEHEAQPFHLADWQMFCAGSLMGWENAEGHRRFRVCYIESGKGSGKSPFAAGIGLYMLTADNEPRAEVYAAGPKKDTAQILFRDAVGMVKQSPALSQRLRFSGGAGREWNIAYLQSASFFRAIAADNSQSGPRPHCALIDEIHEHKDSNVVEMMRAGTKGRRQALIFMITNSGVDRQSVCYQYHEYAGRVCRGELKDDQFFGYVCALDEGDDPFADEAENPDVVEQVWRKANPTLGITIKPSYLREQVNEAKGMPSKEGLVRRLCFSEWTDAFSPWVSGELWRKAEQDFDIAELDGELCFGGLDLSGARDLSSLCLAFPREHDRIDLLSFFWTPGDTVIERGRADRVPYDTWIKQGHLNATPGRVIDYSFIAQFIGELAARYDLRSIAFDPYRIGYLSQDLDEQGVYVDLVQHGQGYFRAQESGLWMPRSVDTLERLVLEGKLRVKPNPVLTWCSASAVLVSDAKGNRIFDKRKSTGRIDGVVAAAMSVGAVDNETGGVDLSDFFRDPVIV